MFPNLPWETLLENFPIVFLLGVLSLCAAGFFCLYRLDKIPALEIPGTLIILLVLRVIDTATFLWASGGEYSAVEVNMVYQIAAAFVPNFWTLMLVIQAGVTVLLGLALGLLWIGLIPRLMWLAIVATFSAMSLAGAVTNVLHFFGLW